MVNVLALNERYAIHFEVSQPGRPLAKLAVTARVWKYFNARYFAQCRNVMFVSEPDQSPM